MRNNGNKLYIIEILRAFVLFGSLTYFTKILSASVIGLYFLFEATSRLLSIFSDFGINGALEKRLSETGDRNPLLSSVLIKISFAIIMSLVLLVFDQQLKYYFGYNILPFLIINIFSYEIFQILTYTLRGEGRVVEAAFFRLVRTLLWSATSLFLLHYSDINPLISAYILSSIVISLLIAKRVKSEIYMPNSVEIRSLFKFSKFKFINELGQFSYHWLDVLIIGAILSQTLVSKYEMAWRITSLVAIYSTSVITVQFPNISNSSSRGQIEKIRQKIPHILANSIVFSVPAALGLFVLSEEILTVLFDEGYAVASFALIILGAEKVTRSWSGVMGRLLEAIDRPALSSRATVAAILVNIILNPVLIYYYGITGAAGATAISSLVDLSIKFYYTSREVRLNLPWKKISIIIRSATLMVFILIIATQYVGIYNLTRVVLLVIISFISYTLLINYQDKSILFPDLN